MKKVIVGVVIVASLAAGFAIAFAATPAKKAIAPATSVSAQPKQSGDTTYVDLDADGAKPDEVSVVVGKTIQFNSHDGKSHNLALSDESQHDHSGASDNTYKSGQFNAGEGWKATFKEAGSFTFVDQLNPKITVLVVAYTPSK